MISIVIPLYNSASTVGRAINSVLNQTYSKGPDAIIVDKTIQDIELIVVDDGSTDGGNKVVEKFSDYRIRLVSQPNRGVSAARNRGIEEAGGEWIAFLDADDEWKPDFLSTVVSLSKKYPDCNVCATAYERQNPDNKTQQILLRNTPDATYFVMDNYFEVASTSDPPFCSISVMVHRDALKAIGGFPEGVKQGEDLLTWARLAVRNKIAYSRKSLTVFHTTEAQSQGMPRRIPPKNDIVGEELKKLHIKYPQTIGLRQYIAHWHKMRASIFMRLPNCERQSRSEIRESLTWNPKNNKIRFYLLLLLLPYRLRMRLLAQL